MYLRLRLTGKSRIFIEEDGVTSLTEVCRLEEAAARWVVCVSKNAVPQIPALLTISQNPSDFC